MTRKYEKWGYWNRFYYQCGAEVDIVVDSEENKWRADLFTKKSKKINAEKGNTSEIKDGKVANLCHNNHCPICNKK